MNLRRAPFKGYLIAINGFGLYVVRQKQACSVTGLLSSHAILEYIDLARAKSEALDNIYSLFNQNIKSCNAKRRTHATPENGEKQQ